MKGNVTLAHALNETGDGGLVVTGGERRRQPQTERPCRRQGRTAGEPGIAFDHLHGRGTIDQEIFERLAADAELDLGDAFRRDFEDDAPRVIDEDAPTGVGQKERDVLVGLLGAGAAVAVPDLDRLPVLHKGGEALAEAVDVVADGKVEALEEMPCLAAAVDGVAGILGAATGQADAVAQEVEAVASLARQNRRQRPAVQGDGRFRLLDTPMPLLAVDLEFRALGGSALEVLDANADHPFGGRDKDAG